MARFIIICGTTLKVVLIIVLGLCGLLWVAGLFAAASEMYHGIEGPWWKRFGLSFGMALLFLSLIVLASGWLGILDWSGFMPEGKLGLE